MPCAWTARRLQRSACTRTRISVTGVLLASRPTAAPSPSPPLPGASTLLRCGGICGECLPVRAPPSCSAPPPCSPPALFLSREAPGALCRFFILRPGGCAQTASLASPAVRIACPLLSGIVNSVAWSSTNPGELAASLSGGDVAVWNANSDGGQHSGAPAAPARSPLMDIEWKPGSQVCGPVAPEAPASSGPYLVAPCLCEVVCWTPQALKTSWDAL